MQNGVPGQGNVLERLCASLESCGVESLSGHSGTEFCCPLKAIRVPVRKYEVLVSRIRISRSEVGTPRGENGEREALKFRFCAGFNLGMTVALALLCMADLANEKLRLAPAGYESSGSDVPKFGTRALVLPVWAGWRASVEKMPLHEARFCVRRRPPEFHPLVWASPPVLSF